jgi:ATP-dependent DNA helicase RecQ
MGSRNSASPSASKLLSTLKQHFGYDSFRPLQQEIIEDSLAGKDVFALLPTGGGKSLCFQLPALLRDGLTVVVSPLIALMKDQVDALTASGIPATFLNSTLDAKDAKGRFRGLHRGEFKLLYAAPERLLLPNFLETLKQWNVVQIAIDEAHCVSEWGHDFRPEYRQLAQLREAFPDAPWLALTATATERVQLDIIQHLQLRQPRTFVASFNRPNLQYRVLPKSKPFDQTLALVKARPREAGIIYCASRKTAESVAERLQSHGLGARPYHAGLTASLRAENQDLFLRDRIRIICATIAFGMGINKPNVRYVLHYDLPKNIEGYYQETGRAGRDGLPSDCILLFSAGDVVKQTSFIDEKSDPEEQRLARTQLRQMVHFAECPTCRRAELLRYFSEQYPEENCGGCDNCLAPRETFDGTLAAQKLLSCAFRVRQKNGFSFGLNHLVEILAGGQNEPIRRWGHDQLSVYGIGSEHKRADWQAIGRQLIRLGLLKQSTEKFATVDITQEGLASLKDRRRITLTKPVETADRKTKVRKGEIECDELLFDRLRDVRRRLADDRNVPAYIIFSDVPLREMARQYPTNREEFASLPGVGAQKLRDFSEPFLEEIRFHLVANPNRNFPPP